MFKFRIFIIIFILFTSAVYAQDSNVYKFAREFNLAQVTNQAPSPELNDLLRDKRAIDERYVGPFEIEPYSINVTEYDLMTVYTNTDIDAWHSCTSMASHGYGRNWSTSQISDVSGYIICTRSNSLGKFASLWFLQNDVGFQVSTQDYYVAQNGITSKIASVAIGTFGDYCPREYVHEIWPPLPQRPDGNTQTQLMCNVSYDAYYRLALSGNIAVNDEDADGDEVPGFADFDGEDTEFKVWDIRIPEYLQSSSTMFRFEYDASHPEDVYLDESDGTYKIANNNSLRVWTKDARQERIPLAVDLKGDYVGPGEYSYTELVHGQEVLSLYIEGVAPAQGEIKLSYLREGESKWACFDGVDFGVTKMELFTDFDLTIPLDDWPEATNAGSVVALRSPKYIFGKDDNIYIRVKGPAGQTFSVNVKSESDTTGLDLPLTEYESGIYYNDQLGDLLRLDSSTYTDTDAKYIKIVDEELLSFELKKDDSTCGNKCTVMVDRGEFATATARSYDAYLPGGIDVYGPNRTPIWNDAANEFVSDINDTYEGNLNWWNVGNVRGSYSGNNVAFINSLLYAGENQNDNYECDFYYSQSHGNQWGDLSGTRFVSSNPAVEEAVGLIDASSYLSGIWNDDLDWPIIKACSILCHTNVGREHWQNALTQQPRPAHGILSFEGLSSSDYDGFMDDLFDEIGARHTIITSWINANTVPLPWSDQPYGIVYHTECADDRWRRPSEGISLTADVISSNFSYLWRDESGTEGTDSLDDFQSHTFRSVEWDGKKSSHNLRIKKSSTEYSKIRFGVYDFNIDSLKEQFDICKKFESGRIELSNNIDLDVGGISLQNALKIAQSFMRRFNFPDNAVFTESSPILLMCNDSESERIVGYNLVFMQRINGIFVAGNSINLLIQEDGVKSVYAYWNECTSCREEKISICDFSDKPAQHCFDFVRTKYGENKRRPDAILAQPLYYKDPQGDSCKIVWGVRINGFGYVMYDDVETNAFDSTKIINCQRNSTSSRRH